MRRQMREHTGSSPLARGLLLSLFSQAPPRRIIPARAGFTVQTTRKESWAQDHPRSRGVYSVMAPPRHTNRGSSPLARGLPDALKMIDYVFGIIPARAGFTRVILFPLCCLADHPRSRGVYYYTAWPWVVDTGSSPLARGLLLPDKPRHRAAGIIPARAGFTLGDRRDSNGGPPYQGAFAFTGDLGTARLSCGSVVAGQRSTTTPSPV